MENKSKFHIGLHVSNIEETSAFYSVLFNKPPLKQKSDYVKFELDDPDLVISFSESKDANQTNFGHMGIRVASSEEVTSIKKSLEALIKIDLEEKNTNCCYARQDKFWVSDPDGYRWEVYHFIKDAQPGDQQQELMGCC